jgi:crotonobetainyl-CoA:carnitine CoA-transferase CaiB-like acyl-CoA transferase
VSPAALLGGVRVVDLSRLLPGPFCTRLLSDLGADVIKVEQPGGDYVRQLMPGLYEFLNRGKRSIAVDLKVAEGTELVLQLIATADVVVESFRPGVADRLGVGLAAARARRRDIIYCSLSGYGQDGALRDAPGHDIGYEAHGGGFAGVLVAGDTPAPPHLPVGDLSAASLAALSICATLLGRARTPGDEPRALQLDVAIQEALTYFAASRWGGYLATGRTPRVEEMANFAPGHGIFPTADGDHLAVAAIEDKFWRGLCCALDRSDLAAPPYNEHEARMQHRAELRDQVQRAIGAHPAAELMARFQAQDVPAERVRTAAEVCADPALQERGLVRAAEAGGFLLDFPVRIDGVRSRAALSVPRPGGDTDAILEDLGVDAAERERLHRSGALAVPE